MDSVHDGLLRTSSRRVFLRLAGTGAWLPGWAADAQSRSRIEVAWFRERLAQETERTLKTQVTPTGFLGRAGPASQGDRGGYRPTGLGNGTPTNQGRNLFVLAAGHDLARKPEFLQAVTKAADFLLAHFRDRQYGGLFAVVDPDGKALDDRKESYGTAHAILGMSHAARVTGRTTYGDAAMDIWSDMKRGLRDQHGFFKRETSRDFKVTGPGKNTQNPMMHLFEALLALHDATQSKAVLRDIEGLASAVLTRLFQEPGYIPELFDRDWKPVPAGPPGQTEPDGSPLDPYNRYASAQTGHIEIGHLLEWAFFLSRAVEKGLPRKYLSFAERLLDYSMKAGYDRQSGGVVSTADYNGKPTSSSSTGGWQQPELLRALMNWAVLRDRQDLWEPFDRSLSAAKNSESPPGGYHGCGMYAEALRLAALKS